MLHYVWGSSSCIARNSRACTQTTQHHIPEERDLSQRKCMAYYTIPLHKHKKEIVNKSYHDLLRQTLRYKLTIMICRDRHSGTNEWPWSADTDLQVQMDDHDLQRQTPRYKWMIMICRDRPSGTNGWSSPAETDPWVQMDDHNQRRQTLRYKWMSMNCRDRLSGINGWSWSAETNSQVQKDDHDLQGQSLKYKMNWKLC